MKKKLGVVAAALALALSLGTTAAFAADSTIVAHCHGHRSNVCTHFVDADCDGLCDNCQAACSAYGWGYRSGYGHHGRGHCGGYC